LVSFVEWVQCDPVPERDFDALLHLRVRGMAIIEIELKGKWIMFNRHKSWLFALAALGSIVSTSAIAQDTDLQLLFVQTAADFRADVEAQTLRLVNVNQQTLYFSDRPNWIADHVKMDDYLLEWTTGDDNFGENPPNATLSVY
jgi:hypothetical protein